jgi:hypothetical protein
MLDELESRLDEARTGTRRVGVKELEALYTSGCAEILELEADAMRIARRVKELRDQLRHLRTAIEFLQQEQTADEAAQ